MLCFVFHWPDVHKLDTWYNFSFYLIQFHHNLIMPCWSEVYGGFTRYLQQGSVTYIIKSFKKMATINVQHELRKESKYISNVLICMSYLKHFLRPPGIDLRSGMNSLKTCLIVGGKKTTKGFLHITILLHSKHALRFDQRNKHVLHVVTYFA